VILGIAGAWAGARLIAPLLFEISPHEPWTLIAAGVAMVAVAAVAPFVPARRVGGVDPASWPPLSPWGADSCRRSGQTPPVTSPVLGGADQLTTSPIVRFTFFRNACDRVYQSFHRQAGGKGLSLDAQREKLRAMAVVHDTELAESIVDAESAKNLDRPGMKRILDLVRGGVDSVIVAKLDRLTRPVRDLADLLDLFQRKGVALVSVAEALDTGSAAGRLVLNIMVSVSQ
jgi:hypothetical protein